MSDQLPHKAQWSSRLAFILAASGSAIGLGNIWKFPYLLGEHGGGAFVLVYLIFVLFVGLPIMMAETVIGRLGKQSPVNSMRSAAKQANASQAWQLVGWLGLAAGFLILSYYSVIAGWSMAYLFKMAGGFLANTNALTSQQTFEELRKSADVQLVWHTAFMISTMLIVSRELSTGIERVTGLMMPALFIMLATLDIYAFSSDGFSQGMQFLFEPDFSKLTGESLLIALGQAFFSLGLGMGAIMAYGAYLPDRISITRSTIAVAGADTVVALMAGIAIFPIVFANHLEPTMGPGLIFETLPIAFSKMPGGTLFGSLFFLLVFFAAITSAVALIEPTIAWLTERMDVSRAKASVWAGSACWLMGIGTVFSFSSEDPTRWSGRNFYELIDFVTSDLMLPIGGILIAIFVGWILKNELIEKELELGNRTKIWHGLIRYVAPLSVAAILLSAVSLI